MKRRQLCINKNDKKVQELLYQTKKNISQIDKALVYMLDNNFTLSTGNVLSNDLSNLSEVSLTDLFDVWAVTEPDKNPSVMSTKEATSKMLNKLQKRLASVKNDLDSKVRNRNTSEEKEIYERLKERKEGISNDIQDLESSLTDSQMLTVAENQLQAISTLLNNDTFELSKDELTDVDSTLKIFKDYTVNYIPKPLRTVVVKDSSGVEIQVASDLSLKARTILDNVTQLEELFKIKDRRSALNTFQNVINADTGEEVFDSVVDENWWNSKVRQMSTSGIQIAQSVALYIKTLNSKAKTYQKNLQDSFDKSFTDLKDSSPLFQQYGFDLMYKKDKDGKKTPFTVTAYTDAFEIEFQEKNMIFKNEEATTEDWGAYYAWKKANYNTETFIGKSPEAIEIAKSKMRELYGSSYGDKIIKALEDKAERYYAEELNAKDTLTGEDFTIWVKNNNPLNYINASKYGDAEFDFKDNDANYKRFVYSFVKSGNINPEYKQIYSDAAYANFFENFLDLIGGYVNDMPFSYATQKGIVKNMIPYTKKSVSNLIFKEGNFGKAGKQSWETFLGYFSVAGSEESVYQEYDEITGSHSLGVPIHFLQPLTKIVDGEVVSPIDTMETDLMKVAQMIIPQIAKYKYQMASLGTLEQASRIVGSLQESKGFDPKGNPDVVNNGLNNLKAMLDNETKSFLGESSNKAEGAIKKLKMMTAEQKAEIVAIEEKKQQDLKELKEKIEKILEEGESLKDNATYIQISQAIEDRYEREKDSKTRFFSIGKSARSLMKYYVFKTLGFSPSFVFESFQSLMSVSIDAAGSDLYDYKDYMGSIFNGGRFSKNKNKNLRNLFNITSSTEYGEGGNKVEKTAMWLAEQQDILQKSAIMEAMMKKQKIQALDGTEVSLYDAYDDNGEWKSVLFSENTNADWNPNTDLDSTESANSYYRFLDKLDAQNIRLFGAYGENVYLDAKRSTVGKALMMFKTWLGEAIAIRFEAKKTRLDLGTDVKGRWRTLGEVMVNNKLKDSIPALFLGRTQGLILNDAELDAANMKRNMVEMYILIGVFVSALGLAKALADDEEEGDENFRMAMMICLNLAGRMQQDILYYISPSEGDKLFKNAIPVFKLYKDFEQLAEATYKTLEGNPTYKSGEFKNWGRIPKELTEFLPAANGALKYYKLANEDMTAYK